jgi:hypothetical protein
VIGNSLIVVEGGTIMLRGFANVLCSGVLLCAAAAWGQPQGNGQQGCINKINKDTIKVHAAQGKLNAACIKDAVKVGSDAEACIAADGKGKVAGKRAKTVEDEMKKCVSLNPQPAFAYTSATIANDAAEQAEQNLIHDVFGSPSVNPGLFSCDTNPAECLCQRQGIDRVEKLFRAVSKLFVKCKKLALAIGHDPFMMGAASPSDIADCVTNAGIGVSVAADTKGKVADATGQLSATLSQFCTVGGEFNGGACTGLSGNLLVDCLANHTKCRFCQMVNGADALTIDCGMFSAITCP